MRAIVSLIGAALLLGLTASPALADALFGTCKYKGGGVVPDGMVEISTDWNNRKASPRNGRYRLDLAGRVGRAVWVYVDGKKYKQVEVRGDTRLDIEIERRR